MDKEIKPLLESHFLTYFKDHPSHREDSEYIKNLPPDQQWFPNNTIQYIPYEPETERYGGPHAIQEAEKHFMESSDAVLAIIGESEKWEYERAMGAAIQMHLGFAHAVGMDLAETTAFYTEISYMWFARSYGYYESMPPEELSTRQESTWKAFKENFEKQRPVLVPYHEMLWNAFVENVEFEQEWLNRWIRENRVLLASLLEIQNRGQLITPSWYKIRSTGKIPEHRRQLWSVFESYVHMTNNRLGILNRDEAFLGYLVKESLTAIEGINPGNRPQ